MVIIKYDGSSAKREEHIASMELEGKVLVEIMCIEEGNFLGFTEPENIPPVEPTLSEIKEQNLVIMDALATLFETMIGGTV